MVGSSLDGHVRVVRSISLPDVAVQATTDRLAETQSNVKS
ncbi:hypothetical protein FH603_4023 [Spirosoma sp. LMG 31447]|uniref:Uncharacterized protein n=1 Tax=Spirosoma utsteinense TaxID=2585773 RepID=A0ABR6WB63_9BACT|nr:hypothetical protein [Spirosoma utsteinense]